ncbi:MAG: SpoIIE family protein phosphatase [Deltaproteobacteria bacterium]|nr:SpoIIE family protein phosphatase [Deltaproteobacteria bacterium]
MIRLGALSINTPEAFVEARQKMARLAYSLGYSEIHVSRQVTVFSELLRLGRGIPAGVSVNIGIKNNNGRQGLSLEFVFGKQLSSSPDGNTFFDAFEVSHTAEGSTVISAFRYFIDHSFNPHVSLIESLRQMLSLPSRAELLKNLQLTNKELKDSAEQIKQAKEAAEEASLSLQSRVNELAEARHAMLNIMEDLGEANRELETAHRQILDSIRYASRIQRAVLPSESIAQRVFPQYMVIWEPRDVVGGDIYWCRTWGDGHLLILGDCTGHGVPGAFMTLIANGALDQAMQKAEPGDPADLIGHMHRLMQTWLGQDTDSGDSDDGIEVGACYLQPGRGQIVFSGARFSLFWLDRDGEVVEETGDKKGIGYRAVPQGATFTNKLIEVKPGRRFFLTTDGIIDQIGGAKRRGFGKKRFARLITNLTDVPLPEQGKYFLDALIKYQGGEKRRDDVSIIGFSFDRTY